MDQITPKPDDNVDVKTAVLDEPAPAPDHAADPDLTLSIDKPQPLTDGQKETIKITATYLNNVAVGIAVVGGFSSLLGLLYSYKGLLGLDPGSVILLCAAAVTATFLSSSIHWQARETLARLDGNDAKPTEFERASYWWRIWRLRFSVIGISAIFVLWSSLPNIIEVYTAATSR